MACRFEGEGGRGEGQQLTRAEISLRSSIRISSGSAGNTIVQSKPETALLKTKAPACHACAYPAGVDDLNLAVAREGLGVGRQAGGVPAIVTGELALQVGGDGALGEGAQPLGCRAEWCRRQGLR